MIQSHKGLMYIEIQYKSYPGILDMKKTTLGTIIKKLRESHSLTQQQLADMLNITQAPISRWENGEREISLPIMRRIAEVFDMTLSDLMDMADDVDVTDGEPVNIIVIEDVPVELSGTVSMLKNSLHSVNGLMVTGFLTGQEAIVHCRENRVDIAFLDIELNGHRNGLELAAELKSIAPKMKVIILTAYHEYASDAWELHSENIIDDFILKPLTPRRLNRELKLMGNITIRQDDLS